MEAFDSFVRLEMRKPVLTLQSRKASTKVSTGARAGAARTRVAQAMAPVNGAESGRRFLSMEGKFVAYAPPCHGQLPALSNLANENVNTGMPSRF